jgi:putative nucleotidyltransferase with HDIG domain
MDNAQEIVLISDRPDRSQELADHLSRISNCRMVGLHDVRPPTSCAAVAAVIDIDLRRPSNIERLRCQLLRPSAFSAPIVAMLRDESYLERVQAEAVGATVLLPPETSSREVASAVAFAIRPAMHGPMIAAQNDVENARLQFATILNALRGEDIVSKASIDEATESVVSAIAEHGIRRWLEVVWTYHDATYQHCLLVAGLAAEFAAVLRFTANDQMRVTGAALLHDLGKSKIPLCILDKTGPLTNEEMSTMRNHVRIGYELLNANGHFESDQLEVVLKHHELLDGSGYPDGLIGTQINDLVRLVTISDIYAALIERRSYKKRMHPRLALETLQSMEGKLERPLVRAFASVAERSAATIPSVA